MDLETILQKFGYKKIFKKNGELSIGGNSAYGKLVDLIYNLSQLGVITSKEADTIITRIDNIADGKEN